MSATYSYIGKQPVYSELYHCHIWPTPSAKVTEIEIELPVVEKKEQAPRPLLYKLILDYLLENGPATARVISDSIGGARGAVACVLRGNPKRFIKISQQYHVWGLPGQTMDDMRCDYRVPYRDRIIRYLRQVGEADSQQIANHLRISRTVAIEAISASRDRFDVVRRVENAVNNPRLKHVGLSLTLDSE